MGEKPDKFQVKAIGYVFSSKSSIQLIGNQTDRKLSVEICGLSQAKTKSSAKYNRKKVDVIGRSFTSGQNGVGHLTPRYNCNEGKLTHQRSNDHILLFLAPFQAFQGFKSKNFLLGTKTKVDLSHPQKSHT